MNIFEDVAIYLPKYLSEDSSIALKGELKKFSTDGTKDTIYTSKLNQEDTLFQGDGILAATWTQGIEDCLELRFVMRQLLILINI